MHRDAIGSLWTSQHAPLNGSLDQYTDQEGKITKLAKMPLDQYTDHDRHYGYRLRACSDRIDTTPVENNSEKT